jgi:hypothetical protein
MLVKEYFPDHELRCKCCGRLKISQEAVERLYAARIIAGIPFHITSACRCESHNSDPSVGGSENSSHLATDSHDCCAFDIACNDDADRDTILTALRAAGFTRIGIRKDFIHVDYDSRKKKHRTWVY